MKDIDLLYNDSDKLIEKYQNTIIFIINRFIYSGYIRIIDKDDFIQDVNEQLLLKIPIIRKQYNHKYQLSTYLSAIVRNICLEQIRKNKFLTTPEEIVSISPVIYNRGISNLVIADEMSRLENIFLLFNSQKEKLILCLKAFYRISVSESDINSFLNGKQIIDKEQYINFLNNFETLTNQDIFVILTKIINAKENKDNSADAIRKWLNAKIEEIIFLMNGNPKRAYYDKESLQLLIEDYFYKKEKRISFLKAEINIDI